MAQVANSPASTESWVAKDGHHYTVAELADCWNVSTDFVRDLFRNESGVVRWVHSRPGKRRYIVIRIPAVVAQRVYRRAQQYPSAA
jgi:hypothetical protein